MAKFKIRELFECDLERETLDHQIQSLMYLAQFNEDNLWEEYEKEIGELPFNCWPGVSEKSNDLIMRLKFR